MGIKQFFANLFSVWKARVRSSLHFGKVSDVSDESWEIFSDTPLDATWARTGAQSPLPPPSPLLTHFELDLTSSDSLHLEDDESGDRDYETSNMGYEGDDESDSCSGSVSMKSEVGFPDPDYDRFLPIVADREGQEIYYSRGLPWGFYAAPLQRDLPTSLEDIDDGATFDDESDKENHAPSDTSSIRASFSPEIGTEIIAEITGKRCLVRFVSAYDDYGSSVDSGEANCDAEEESVLVFPSAPRAPELGRFYTPYVNGKQWLVMVNGVSEGVLDNVKKVKWGR
ncbi:hypothetical protein CC1G_10868 [Coprinopsis cinerea okayama7|uniref:Uncharacterized protein n=1 Tax=Coprinopsis cinerea (strain Okayama-7 / 130 / ATCC MYA-4618 / FGSC 9003) TaxID=240176 RepID=A8NKU9_COPC7|nr:hypothetical protein CC1G_10868 [Coprinopsis cinerea okayama7\|eukprot:XP_001834550.1 hypothetical protein CC1G_10868 [Coprinopsis cinerea okayama7\